MSLNFKKFLSVGVVFLLMLSVTACSSDKQVSDNGQNSSEGGTVSDSGDKESNTASDVGTASGELSFAEDDMFTDRDSRITYDSKTAVLIKADGSKLAASSNSVVIKGNKATVTAEGTYIISGTASDGQIVVEADESAKIQLVLNGVDISCTDSAAIYVKSADKVFVTLADGTKNTLKTSGTFKADGETNVDGVVFSKSDITFNGNGALSVTTASGHGIVTKDDLVFTGGNYTVEVSGHALSGKDSIRVKQGTFTLKSGKDGLHSEHTENTQKGFVYISGGSLDITSDGDGVDASNSISVLGGSFNIVSGGGAENAEKKSKDFGFGGFKDYQQETSTDSTSCKGIKADGSITLSGCEMNINSADDAVHCGGTLNIKSGDYNIATGDDGLHSDAGVVINDGNVVITESYEGIEGLSIDINGGVISVTASDDGMNAAGGADQSGFGGMMGRDEFQSDSERYISITNGYIVVNASGDGIDANGNVYMKGGECYVSGPTNSGNGFLDYDGSATVTGGVFIATGTSGMAQNFGTSSTQGSILVSVGSSSGEVSLLDKNGKTLASFIPQKSYQCVLITSPAIAEGETYTIKTDSDEQTVTMTSLIYGETHGMGGFGGGMGRPDGGGHHGKW